METWFALPAVILKADFFRYLILLARGGIYADIDTEAITVEGTVYRRVLRREETYMTAAGEVRVMRTLYKDRTDEAERAVVPMEQRVGVVEGFWTPEAAKQAARAFVDFILSDEGQKLAVAMGYIPAKAGVGMPAWYPAGVKINLMPTDIPKVVQTNSANLKRFSDLFGN
jgi:hypothetical protein